MIGSHYSLYLIPSIFISLIFTFRSKDTKEGSNLARYMIIASCLMSAIISPISPLSTTLNDGSGVLWYPGPNKITERTTSMHSILERIPRNASVLTQNHIFPHVSGRLNAYVLPLIQSENETETLERYVLNLIEESDYIILDVMTYDHWTAYTHKRLITDPRFGVCTYDDMVVLFERGLNNLSKWNRDHMVFRASTDLYVGQGYITSDIYDVSSFVVSSPMNSSEGYVVYGPYTYLVDGDYFTSLRIRVSGDTEGHICTFEVTSDMGKILLGRRDLFGFEFPTDEWRQINTFISLDGPRGMVEFRVHTTGVADIYIDYVEVKRRTTPISAKYSTTTFTYRDLIFPRGYVTKDKLMRRDPDKDRGGFWYGPYQRLPVGEYNVSYYIKAIPTEVQRNDPVIRLDVCYDSGRHILTYHDITQSELDGSRLRNGWSFITMNFTLNNPEALLEFRGMETSTSYTIYLGMILVEPRGLNGLTSIHRESDSLLSQNLEGINDSHVEDPVFNHKRDLSTPRDYNVSPGIN
ncbi:putative membrane protein (DUF2079) [Thaumarchaeota archaeon SCGC AB-539-E09]|nr:putative membrane protein (DUF2079) [Thaumarchaeota archaeon SCGC AB-539-E09]